MTEKAGDVGVCWSISSGAVIARTVYGAPDGARTSAGLNGLLNLTSKEREFRQRLMTKEADYNPSDGNLLQINAHGKSNLAISIGTIF